jgi:hypothetical protein
MTPEETLEPKEPDAHDCAHSFTCGFCRARASEAERLRVEKDRAEIAGRAAVDAQCNAKERAEAKLTKLLEAAGEVAEGGLSFGDPRVDYEEWQITKGAMARLRAAIYAAKGQENEA